jgi:hypothetical protein
VTRLLQPAAEIEVALDPQGAPGSIVGGPLGGPLGGRVEPLSRWLVEQDWWERPVAREYWKLLVGDRLLVEVFHDLLIDRWFIERVYD